MKKLFNCIRSKLNSVATRATVAVSNVKAEGYVDSGVKILIAVVIGALLLSGLWTGMELNKREKSDIICIRADEKGYHNGKGKVQRRNETPDRQVCT